MCIYTGGMRIFKDFFLTASLIFILLINNIAFAVDVRFGVFSDTHTFYNPGQYPDQYHNAENKLLPILQMFQSVNQSSSLPFVVHLGDLYEDHTNVGSPENNINYTESFFDQFSCKLLSSNCFDIYLAMGNHDSNMINSGVERSEIGTALSNYYFSDDPTFGRYDYDWVTNGYRFIVIDSSYSNDVGGEISPETLAWLANTLSNAHVAGQSAFIFLHHRIDDSSGKASSYNDVIMWSQQAHEVRAIVNDSGANVLGIFMGHSHVSDARSSEEITGWPSVPENNWYKVPLLIEPSRGDRVTEDGHSLIRGTGACSGIGTAGTWEWEGGTLCYSPSSGVPLDHQVDVFGSLDDYAVNYYSIKASQGSTAASPSKGDQSGAIVEVTGTNKEGVVIHGFAEMANYHTPYTAYIDETGKSAWDSDTSSSGSIYDPFPTMRLAESRTSSSSIFTKPSTFLIKSGRIRESGVIYPKGGSASAPVTWICEDGAKITN